MTKVEKNKKRKNDKSEKGDKKEKSDKRKKGDKRKKSDKRESRKRKINKTKNAKLKKASNSKLGRSGGLNNCWYDPDSDCYRNINEEPNNREVNLDDNDCEDLAEYVQEGELSEGDVTMGDNDDSGEFVPDGELSEGDISFDDNDSLMDPDKYGTLTESDETDTEVEIFEKPKRVKTKMEPKVEQKPKKFTKALFVGLVGDCPHKINDEDFQEWCLLHFNVPQTQIIMSKELGRDSKTVEQLNTLNFDRKVHKYAFLMFDNKDDKITSLEKNGESYDDRHTLIVSNLIKPVSLLSDRMIFVKNLPSSITKSELECFFDDCGTITSVDTTNPTVCVIFKSKHAVASAIKKYDGKYVGDHKISVSRYFPYKRKNLRKIKENKQTDKKLKTRKDKKSKRTNLKKKHKQTNKPQTKITAGK